MNCLWLCSTQASRQPRKVFYKFKSISATANPQQIQVSIIFIMSTYKVYDQYLFMPLLFSLAPQSQLSV